MIQFDQYFAIGLKPPTRKGCFFSKFNASQIHRLLRARADPSATNVREPAHGGVAEDITNHCMYGIPAVLRGYNNEGVVVADVFWEKIERTRNKFIFFELNTS